MGPISFMESGNASDGGDVPAAASMPLMMSGRDSKARRSLCASRAADIFRVPPTSKDQIRQRKPNVDDDEDELVALLSPTAILTRFFFAFWSQRDEFPQLALSQLENLAGVLVYGVLVFGRELKLGLGVLRRNGWRRSLIR